jgi:hypothetical protein
VFSGRPKLANAAKKQHRVRGNASTQRPCPIPSHYSQTTLCLWSLPYSFPNSRYFYDFLTFYRHASLCLGRTKKHGTENWQEIWIKIGKRIGKKIHGKNRKEIYEKICEKFRHSPTKHFSAPLPAYLREKQQQKIA